MLKKLQIFEYCLQKIFVLIFVLNSIVVLADPPEKKPFSLAVSNPVIDENTGDFLPDTVNVFKIAKDVSGIFSEAVKFTSLHDIYGDTVYLKSLFTSNYTSADLSNAYKNDVKARIRAQQGDLGVDFRADYTENFTPGWSWDEEFQYKRRFYFGVEWNVIKGGFLESRAKVGQLKQEYNLKDIDAKKQADAENYRYIFNYINYLFNKQKINVLKERYTLIEQQLKFTTELYHLRYVGWEKVLHVRAKLEDLNQQITQLEDFNQHIPNSIPDELISGAFTAEDLPLVDVDLDKLMQIYHNNETTNEIAAIKLSMYAKGMRWWQDISIRPYVRYNIYMDEFNQATPYGSGGVSLNVPLRYKNKGKLVDAKDAVFKAEGMSEFQAGDNELVNHYAEFAFKLKQIKEFYYKKLTADELIRKELVKKDYQDIGFNPIFTLGLIDDKKNIEAEIVDLKKMLYKKLVQMAFYLDEKSPLAFVEILNPQEFTSRYNTGVQIFIDNATFESMSNNELVNYLWKNEFRDVILEINSWDLSPKINDLIEKASRDHIYFSLNMKIPYGSSYPNVREDLERIKAVSNQYVKGLHYSLILNQNSSFSNEISEVDFSNWVNSINSNNRDNNYRLSITIADNLPINILNRVYSKFDLVFVPSDGTPNRQSLEDKLIQELSLGKSKLTVVLDANNFADRIHLENYMQNVSTVTGVENFAFSNIRNMISADIRTFEMGEQNRVATDDIMATFRTQIFTDDQKTNALLNENFFDVNKTITTGNELVQASSGQNFNTITADTRQINPSVTALSKTASQSPKSWQIQVAASKTSLTDAYLKSKFEVNEPISVYQINGYYKYTIGNYTSENEARTSLKNYKLQTGNAGAFLVSYE